MLIGSGFQTLTELFYILDTRQSARQNYCLMIGLQNFPLWQ